MSNQTQMTLPEDAARNRRSSRSDDAGMMLLPCKPGVCPECAVDHAPEEPHNQQSLYYQYHFYGRHGRWPTWVDAMAHCADNVRKQWTEALAAHGVTVPNKTTEP